MNSGLFRFGNRDSVSIAATLRRGGDHSLTGWSMGRGSAGTLSCRGHAFGDIGPRYGPQAGEGWLRRYAASSRDSRVREQVEPSNGGARQTDPPPHADVRSRPSVRRLGSSGGLARLEHAVLVVLDELDGDLDHGLNFCFGGRRRGDPFGVLDGDLLVIHRLDVIVGIHFGEFGR